MTPLEDRLLTDTAILRGEPRATTETRYGVQPPWRADRDAAAKAHGYEDR